MTTTVLCELTGFPPPTLESRDVQGYLPIWAVMQEIRQSHGTCCVRLTLPSLELYESLKSFCRCSLYQGRHVITPKLLRPSEAIKEKVKKKRRAKARRTKTKELKQDLALQPESSNARGKVENSNPLVAASKQTSQKTRDSSKLPSFKETDKLASEFLTFLHEKSHPLIETRDALALAFQSFIQGTNSSKNRRVEASVVTRMRQRKWMKSSRRSGGIVIVVLVEQDRKTFPAQTERKSARDLVVEQQKWSEEDKEGVSLKIWKQDEEVSKASTIHESIGKEAIIEVELTADAEVTVESIEIRGPHAQCLEPADPTTIAVLANLPTQLSHFRVPYTIKARQSIGIMRVSIHLSLEGEAPFAISRSLTISCGNPALQGVLQAITPYQPRPRNVRVFSDNQNQKVHWPKTHKIMTKRLSRKQGQQERRGLPELGKYPIPKETLNFLQSDEMENVLSSFDWSPKTTYATKPKEHEDEDSSEETPSAGESYKSRLADYGQFWSQLLYISECQSLVDIQLFDMEHVVLERRPNSMYALTVPGLAEGRPSVLRGDLVNLTWNKQLYKGRVHTTELLQVILEVPTKFSKTFNPSLDRVDLVRFTFSRTNFRTSHRACLEWAQNNLGPAVLDPTPAIIEKHRTADFHETETIHVPLSFTNRNLNAEQEQAIIQIVQGRGGNIVPYILFGPPGTGKTTVVVETVYQLAMRKLRDGEHRPTVLLTAPSNDAADILVERLASYFPPKELLRVLAYSRNKDGLPIKIRPYVTQNEEDDEGKLQEILKAKIVVSTVNLAARFVYWGVPKGHFDVICIDEAGHATEPEVVGVVASLLDMKSPNSQLILAGDPKQLGPITTSKICASYGLDVSLLERLSQRSVYQRNQENNLFPHDLLTKLVRNYRSHPILLKLPNEMFYEGDLESSGDMMVTHSMAKWEHLPKSGFPILFHSIQGENLREGNSPSWFNPQEAQQVVAYIDLLKRETKPPLKDDEIGIVTPYARQAQKIRAALEISHPRNEIKVGSVECFQGQERRVIVVSTVRSEPELYLDHDIRYNLGFIAHPKRFNVAMTRAKALLIVIGCPSVLALDKENWFPFLTYCHENGAMIGEAWDPSSTSDEMERDTEAGDEIVLKEQGSEKCNLNSSWELVQAEETFAYISREE